MPDEGQWIAVVGWDRFQHYKDRDVLWVKNYTRLLHSSEYLGLTAAERGILHGIWLEYASARAALRGDTVWLSRRLNARVTGKTLERLSHAGFIRIVASSALAPRYHAASAHALPERREERDKPSAVREGTEEGHISRSRNSTEQQTDQNGNSAKPDLDRILPPKERIEELDQLASKIGQEIP